MPSPFPGMDPYLEHPKVWPEFQHHVVASLYQLLLPGLVDKYRARVGTRQYTAETPLFTSIIKDEFTEEFIEVRSRSDGRLVTLVEVVGIGNRTTTAGRQSYLLQRTHSLAARAGVVEIDLVTQGRPTLDFNREGLPEFHYAVTVTRGSAPDRFEIYTATVAKRLPKFKLPLAADDRDTVVDLQVAVARAFDHGEFGKLLDYTGPLPADCKLPTDARAWVEDWLKKQNVR